MAEAVKVIVRCRPMNTREKDMNCTCVLFMDNTRCSCSIVNPSDATAPPKTFTFDGVYYINSTTEQIYNEITYPLVEGVLEGYNSTVFAYGQTGCGKSFTMQGIPQPAAQRGIIPRAFEHIFEAISLAENMKYLVFASYLEIYNEEIRDLLGRDVKRKLDLKEHTDKGVYVADLSMHPVHNVCECETLMDRGWKNRSVGATLMNADSSRSHSIFTISLEMMSTSVTGDQQIRKGKLNLVDLAGSERQAKTGATGERLKEATKINLSLSALGNVISALVDGKSKHIPYRDSKLTRLLQDSLGGNTKTLMVACLSPADNNYDETLSTLRYANRAKNIKNKPKINEDPKDTMLREYQEEIQKLKEMLETQQVPQEPVLVAPDETALAEERQKVRREFEEDMRKMKEQYEAEQNTKAQLQTEVEKLKRQYEEELARINSKVQEQSVVTQETANHSSPSQVIVTNTPTDLLVDEAMVDEAFSQDGQNLNPAQQEVFERLKKLRGGMVGGERAGDKELKEKRLKKKRAAEKRLEALAKVLGRVDDDDGIMLKVYDDIQEELKVKTEALKKSKQKVRVMEREVSDLQSEFENERTDYLETIRKQDQQIKLLQQILERIQPTVRKDCNYSNIDKIKQEAVWSDDTQKWKLPELLVMRTKLPPAGNPTTNHQATRMIQPGGRAPSRTAPARLGVLPAEDDEGNDDSDILMKKLERSEQEDIAGNYFKPKRATELLIKAQEDSSRVVSKWKGGRQFGWGLNIENSYNVSSTGEQHGLEHRKFANRSKGTNNLLNSSLSQNGFQTLNGLNLNSSINGGLFNTSWGSNGSSNGTTGGGWIGNGFSVSPDMSMRRPTRLEALPAVDKKSSRRKGKSELNTMDLI